MNIGDDVRIDLAGTITAVEPGRLTIRASEGGAVWTVGTVVDVPVGATVEQAAVAVATPSPAPVQAKITYGCGCVQHPTAPPGEYVRRCADHAVTSAAAPELLLCSSVAPRKLREQPTLCALPLDHDGPHCEVERPSPFSRRWTP